MGLAEREAEQVGLENARIAVVAHPIGATARDELARRGTRAADEILALLSA